MTVTYPVIMIDIYTCPKFGLFAMICPAEVVNGINGDEMVISHTVS